MPYFYDIFTIRNLKNRKFEAKFTLFKFFLLFIQRFTLHLRPHWVIIYSFVQVNALNE